MAMYYYASKISAVACGTRCRQSVIQKARGNSNSGNKDKDRLKANKNGKNSEKDCTADDDDEKTTNGCNQLMVLSPDKSNLLNGSTKLLLGSSNELPIVSCGNTAPHLTALTSPSSSSSVTSSASQQHQQDLSNAVLGPGGIMYSKGCIVSGPLDSIVNLLMPTKPEELDSEFVFSFLLSSRLFIRPHELLGRLLSAVPETETLNCLVGLLKIWTKTFPYDFRDERIMCHVKHIVARCANTGLGDVVSELLRALLNRLTDLEHHEEDLRACQTSDVDKDKIDEISWPTSTELAKILCRIERKLAKHVGPEEFVQCSGNVLQADRQIKDRDLPSSSGGGPPGCQDHKKTCNLESYLEWSARLRLLVANEILQCTGIRDRSKIVELWSGAAQYCLLVGNYNSATAILESLDIPPIARLQITWSKLSTTCQQLDCMQKHAEGCGDLWIKQTGNSDCIITGRKCIKKSASSTNLTRPSSSEWVVLPVFGDIVRLALTARDECLIKLPNGHLNIAAFDRLAAIVGAFTRHMSDVNTQLPDVGDFELISRHIQNCTLLSESELMLASFDCEEPSNAEKQLYGVA